MFGSPTMEDNVIGIDDLDTPIYRIFSLDRFSKIVTSRKKWLGASVKMGRSVRKLFS